MNEAEFIKLTLEADTGDEDAIQRYINTSSSSLKNCKFNDLSVFATKPYSLNSLGLIYQDGLGVDKDCKLAIEYYLKSNTRVSFNNLGYLYKNGEGVPIDYTRAMEYLLKSDTSNSLCGVGYMYQYGQGVPIDYTLAMEYYLKANKGCTKLYFLKFYGAVPFAKFCMSEISCVVKIVFTEIVCM